MRSRLPNRRASEVFEFEHIYPTGKTETLSATIGSYSDGSIGEVFINSRRIGTDLDIAVKDAAILLSFALQHGAAVAEMRSAMTRDARGRPEGVMGRLLDILAAEGGQP